jgi:hypothetical protein
VLVLARGQCLARAAGGRPAAPQFAAQLAALAAVREPGRRVRSLVQGRLALPPQRLALAAPAAACKPGACGGRGAASTLAVMIAAMVAALLGGRLRGVQGLAELPRDLCRGAVVPSPAAVQSLAHHLVYSLSDSL